MSPFVVLAAVLFITSGCLFALYVGVRWHVINRDD